MRPFARCLSFQQTFLSMAPAQIKCMYMRIVRDEMHVHAYCERLMHVHAYCVLLHVHAYCVLLHVHAYCERLMHVHAYCVLLHVHAYCVLLHVMLESCVFYMLHTHVYMYIHI